MSDANKSPLQARVDELEKIINNLQMAVSMSQAFLQRMNQQIMKFDGDITNSMGVMNDLQYRTLAMMELGDFDLDKLNEEADKLKLKDFTDASDKEDEEKGFTVGKVTNENSIVIITSTTGDDNDAGIFRSKFAISDSGLPQLKEDLVGKKVGDEVVADLNGIEHKITILGIRELPEIEEDTMEEVATACEEEEVATDV